MAIVQRCNGGVKTQLNKSHSMCGRCMAGNPMGKVLWAWLRVRVRGIGVARYWNETVFRPNYAENRLYNEMSDDLGMNASPI